MIRRFLALVALLTLALMSAASAHEHGMRHAPAAVETTTQVPGAPTPATQAADHAVVWLAAAAVSVCDDTAGDACHNHGTFADCTCPAACAGLFSLAAASPRLTTEASAAISDGSRRLLAMSSAPPTPPPRS